MKTQLEPIKGNVEINLTSDDLAKLFIEWGSDKQGEFFNLIGKHFECAHFNAEMQSLAITDEINEDGKHFIYTLANFLKVQGISCGLSKEETLLNSYKD